MTYSPLVNRLIDEAEGADATYGPFTSTHEGFGVLSEEVAELLEAIRANDRVGVQHEALQVAAVAMRLSACCDLTQFATRSKFA